MSAAVLVLNTCKSYSYSLLCLLWISFKIVAWKSDLLIIYGRQLQPHKHTLSHLLKQTYFLGISEKPSLEISDCCARYCFLRNMFCRSVNLPNFCTTFLRALIEHIGNKNQSVKSNFAALKNYIMVTVSLTENEQNTCEFLMSSIICS